MMDARSILSFARRRFGVDAADLLGPAPQLLSAGNPILFIALKDQAAVRQIGTGTGGSPRAEASGRGGVLRVRFHACRIREAYSRMFAPEFGVVEDPATGSATGPLAAYMMQHKLVASEDGSRFVSGKGPTWDGAVFCMFKFAARTGKTASRWAVT